MAEPTGWSVSNSDWPSEAAHVSVSDVKAAMDGLDGLLDFDGCSSSSCRPRNRPWKHTFAWGLCEHAPESARPEPRITLMGTFLADDGGMSIGTTSYTVTELAAKIEAALREVGITLGPKSLELLQGGHRMHLTGGEYQAMALTVATMLAGEYP